MKLYGNDFSFNSTKVRFAANAMGIPYEFQSVDLAGGEQRTEAFRKITPVGRIPVLVDGDFIIFESNSIMRYLAQKTDSHYYPRDLKKRCLVDQWLDFSVIHISAGAMSKIFFNTIVYKFINGTKDENSLKEGRQFLTNYLGIIEMQFGNGSHVCGNALSLADFSVLATLDPCEVVGFDLTPFPKIVAWRKKLQTQPFYQKVYPSFSEFLSRIMQKA